MQHFKDWFGELELLFSCGYWERWDAWTVTSCGACPAASFLTPCSSTQDGGQVNTGLAAQRNPDVSSFQSTYSVALQIPFFSLWVDTEARGGEQAAARDCQAGRRLHLYLQAWMKPVTSNGSLQFNEEPINAILPLKCILLLTTTYLIWLLLTLFINFIRQNLKASHRKPFRTYNFCYARIYSSIAQCFKNWLLREPHRHQLIYICNVLHESVHSNHR